MIPLGTPTVPATAADWHDALAGTMTQWFSGGSRLTIDGEPPHLRSVDADLSGCRLSDDPPPDVTIAGRAEPGPTIDRLHVAARRLVVRRVPINVELSAEGVQLLVGRTAAAALVVALAAVAHGHLVAHVAAADLDAAVLAAARAGAAVHAVEVRSAHAVLTARSPRDVDVAVELTVKKFVTFPLKLTGRVTVNDALIATVTNLTVDGTGIAKAAVAIVRPLLAKAEGRSFPLAAAGPVRLRDVAVDVTDGLRVTAAFGGTAR